MSDVRENETRPRQRVASSTHRHVQAKRDAGRSRSHLGFGDFARQRRNLVGLAEPAVRKRNEEGKRRQPDREGDRTVGSVLSVRGGGAEIVRQGSSHEGRQTLMVNRAPRTAAVTRHCTPVFELHVFLSSSPTLTFNCPLLVFLGQLAAITTDKHSIRDSPARKYRNSRCRW